MKGLCGWLLVLALMPLAAIAGAPAGSDPARIELKDFHFSPTALTVGVGATVSWKNLDEEPHTIAAVDGTFRSGALDTGDEFRYTFTRAGTYRYVCSIHPQMTGTIVVK